MHGSGGGGPPAGLEGGIMDVLRVSDSVRRITVLRKDGTGKLAPVTVYRRTASTKKGTRLFKFVERATRHLADAQARSADTYRSRHQKSNRKKKDGWIRDFPLNAIRASRKGAKALKLNRIFSL
jgi:hypothetical protein